MSASTDPLLPLREHVVLAPFTSFGIGGAARYFVEASAPELVSDALFFAREHDISWCIIGGGTNIIVQDAGVDGLVIRMAGGAIDVSGTAVSAGAGVPLSDLVDAAASAGLTGMELLAGIPGSVGGAVRGNAGAFGTAIGDVVEEVWALDSATCRLHTFTRNQCRFGYRTSLFKTERNLVVISARLRLFPDAPCDIRARVAETLRKRSGLPQSEMSAGSFFLNPQVNDPAVVRRFEEERGVVCRNCRIPAGWLIEQAGLRGATVGGAKMSERHANYLVNTGTATAEDVVVLASLVRRQVRERLGVELEEEVMYIGFTSN